MGQKSYDVRIYKVDVYRGKKTTTYWVQWSVAGRRFKLPFKTAALADSRRSELLTAARKGEAFDTESGLPASKHRATNNLGWYDFACKYADHKWTASAKTRKSVAEALTAVTEAMLITKNGRPDSKVLRQALRRWAFNKTRRDLDRPDEIAFALRWVERNAEPVSALAEPKKLQAVIDALATKLDGKPAAPNYFNRRRTVLYNALTYAVVLEALGGHPMRDIERKVSAGPRKARTEVDRRCVVNPSQARVLLNAVGTLKHSGPRLVAFFALMYYAALRPEEAANVRRQNLNLPDEGWGEITLERAAPDAGSDWTDSGRPRDDRQLKHRAEGDTRVVPSPPELTALLHAHLKDFGTATDGRLFRGARSGDHIDSSTYERIWSRARCLALTPEQAASPLGRRPYDLRHAAVSTWLNGGVDPTQVAEWAGHSLRVLLDVYAKCLDGGKATAQQRIEAALKR